MVWSATREHDPLIAPAAPPTNSSDNIMVCLLWEADQQLPPPFLQVHAILRKIVARTLESEDCKGMVQFTHLQRDIARTASEALDAMRLEARKMVTTMVEMERSYLTAEVFKEILQADGRNGEGNELIRTLSGRQVRPHLEHQLCSSCMQGGQHCMHASHNWLACQFWHVSQCFCLEGGWQQVQLATILGCVN